MPNGGKSVFVTVGTGSFDRLIDVVDTDEFQQRLRELGYINIVYQIGCGRRIPSIKLLHIKVFRFSDDLEEYIKNSNLVISHCGSGTVLDVFKYRRHALFVANDEVADNHQQQLYSLLNSKYCTTLDKLKDRLNTIYESSGEFYDKLLPRESLNKTINELFE